MEKKIIKMDGRKVEFFGIVTDGVMAVTHVVDPSRSRMYEFHCPTLGRVKPNVDQFDTPARAKARATAKAKHGIAKSTTFQKYTCELEMQADADGDNFIDIKDIVRDRVITTEFCAKHWEIKECNQTSQDTASL